MSEKKISNKKRKFWNLEGFKNSDLGMMFNPINIEMKGNREVIIEGVKNIFQYDENMVKVSVHKMAISFFGRNLEIKCLSTDSLVIRGFITSIEFET